MQREIYLDNNATTRPLTEVRKAMLEVLGQEFGNPSSAHGAGDRGRARLHRARETTATLLGCHPDQIVFTSGGTEANCLALLSTLEADPRSGRLITTEVEHSSVLRSAEFLESRGIEVVYLPVDRTGLVDIEQLKTALVPRTRLVSIQWVNNETGVIQPMEEIARLCQERGVPLHTDAAQAVGKTPVDVGFLPVDFLSLTGHKLHAPPGVGALYCREPRRVKPRLHGGPQESGIRPGTENLPGIVGLGVAMALRHDRFQEVISRMQLLRDTFERGVLDGLADVEINGAVDRRVANTTNLHFRGLDGQALTARLDQLGIRCSQSSACTNQRPEPSYVLQAMGLSEAEAYASVRFSVSEETTEDEIRKAVEAVVELHQRLASILVGRISVAVEGGRE